MRRCPTCNRSFTDQNLSFCLDDGATLVADDQDSQKTAIFPDPPRTVQMPPPRGTERVGAFSNSPRPPQPYGWANDSPRPWVPPPPPSRPANQDQTLAMVSLILGLLAITFGWICGGPVFGFFAVLLGSVALLQIKSNPGRYSGKVFALIGLLTGGIMLLFTIAMFVFWIVMVIIGSMSG